VYSKQFDKQMPNRFTTGMWIVSYCGTHRANSQPFGDWEAEENGTDEGKGRLQKAEFGQDAAINVEEEAIFVQS